MKITLDISEKEILLIRHSLASLGHTITEETRHLPADSTYKARAKVSAKTLFDLEQKFYDQYVAARS